ncbi:MAG: hypothetical protein Q4D58_02865 [Synergistaceae bacterium]|nr:hypothetical protein [Synergistaceae bacterium]
MLKATLKIYDRYNIEDRKRNAELAKKTLEQIYREYLERLFTAACRHRFDIWDFAQKFASSDFSLSLDRPEELLKMEPDELFRDFMIRCAADGTEIESVADKKGGMSAFRVISPEGAWLAGLYSKWHAKTGEAICEIAERAPASLLKRIHRKAMTHPAAEIIELLLENSAAEALITSKDYDLLEAKARQSGEAS